MQVFSCSNNQSGLSTLGSISTERAETQTTQDRHIRLNKILAVNNKTKIVNGSTCVHIDCACAYIQTKSTSAQAVRCVCAAGKDCQRQCCNDRCDFLHFQNPHNRTSNPPPNRGATQLLKIPYHPWAI